MPTNRREFVHLSILAAGAAGLTGQAPEISADTDRAATSLKILVLGGTGLIGPPMVEYAVARGHEVTLFNRGTTNTHLFPDLEKLRGDRDGDLASLEAAIAAGRRWDAVIDNPASIPRWVTASAGLLAGHADLYLYTSSRSAYADHSIVDADEDAP
ncbi:MAG: NAD-dependent epimerase/dehydratase family protein, partial [Holophagae bacterium]